MAAKKAKLWLSSCEKMQLVECADIRLLHEGNQLLQQHGSVPARLRTYPVRRFRIVYAVDQKRRIIRLMAVGHRRSVYGKSEIRVKIRNQGQILYRVQHSYDVRASIQHPNRCPELGLHFAAALARHHSKTSIGSTTLIACRLASPLIQKADLLRYNGEVRIGS